MMPPGGANGDKNGLPVAGYQSTIEEKYELGQTAATAVRLVSPSALVLLPAPPQRRSSGPQTRFCLLQRFLKLLSLLGRKIAVIKVCLDPVPLFGGLIDALLLGKALEVRTSCASLRCLPHSLLGLLIGLLGLL